MSETIQIWDGEREYYTAKEAMQYAVEYMKSPEPHAMQTILCGQGKKSDSEAELFIRMFGRFLHKNHSKVFILTETETLLAKLIEKLPERYTGLQIVSVATMEETGISDDMILNRVNGDDVDCIIAALSETVQEEFISRYRTSLDAKIWVGVGTKLRTYRKLWDFGKVKDIWIRQFKKRSVK